MGNYVTFLVNKCPKCGKIRKLMLSNNPLSGTTICFNCIQDNLNHQNLEHGEFFCRTYNLAWKPDLWIQLADENGANVFEVYTELILSAAENQPNLAFESSTRDL
jgi:hypothetical protein